MSEHTQRARDLLDVGETMASRGNGPVAQAYADLAAVWLAVGLAERDEVAPAYPSDPQDAHIDEPPVCNAAHPHYPDVTCSLRIDQHDEVQPSHWAGLPDGRATKWTSDDEPWDTTSFPRVST